ncbi:HlyB/MsbA family ABC transporter, putative [Rhizoctonia solani AG-3 Rhs1AP]|uniref:HlyB/MsbA family ABC transporter, putative n=2 Tax=Rhizoctonia solani AG-3 TaxID=1086053 RepID=A0A0A1ULC5_9AGAM|nr:HlyB/MsbA family ABC transporter, putative [Rhizoctonia solani AG-3 Rhs1AP]KEP47756.1 putative HlyB/MsbA family ABC transporter [Rhizoctonia solani 123E]
MADQSRLRFRGQPTVPPKPAQRRNAAVPSPPTKPGHQCNTPRARASSSEMEYTNLGVWDYYEQRWTAYDSFPGVRYYLRVTWGLKSAPYALLLIRDAFTLTPYLFTLYAFCFTFESVLPAIVLKYNMQILDAIRIALETRAGNSQNILRIAFLRALCHFAQRLCTFGKLYAAQEVELRVQSQFSQYIVEAYARLDLPTFNNESVQSQIECAGEQGSPSVWSYATSIFNVFGGFLGLTSQFAVLVNVLSEDKILAWMALFSFVEPVLSWWSRPANLDYIWKASVNNKDYIKMEGFKQSVQNRVHRTDIVAGGLSDYIRQGYQTSSMGAGIYAQSIWDARRFLTTRKGMNAGALLTPLIKDVPQLLMALRAIESPHTSPLSLAQLDLVQTTVTQFAGLLVSFFHMLEMLAKNLRMIKNLYDLMEIPNEVRDAGKEGEPLVATGSLEGAPGIEFQNVCFKYPRTTNYVIRNMSFCIKPGQLCVFVGENGSAKSTTLKLIARLYDAENQITIDGRDIRSIPLESLRKHIVLLSQDFSIFPLQVRDNIAIGSPRLADDESSIQEAIRLGGVADFVDSLPQGLDSYLIRPVHDWSSGLGNEKVINQNIDVSGGQRQRIALARAFMRVNDPDARLWLFDEPSASLDPVAESALFERLRDMRGSRTIIFSSHRFGGLTPFADLILYFKDARITEAGTHTDLMQLEGGYARFYKEQAQSFPYGSM